MGHFKSNVRDIEFNLFEVFGTDKILGSGPFHDLDEDTVRGIIEEVAKLAEGPLAASFVDADRNPPVFDPASHSVTDARVVQEVLQGRAATASGGGWRPCPSWAATSFRAPWSGPSPSRSSARTRPCTCTWPARRSPESSTRTATPTQKKIAQRMVDRGWGATMVLTEPDAGSDVGAGPHQGGRAARRLLAHRGRQAVHHLGRARHDREHHPPGAGPAGGRRPRHQGAVAVRRAEVPLRPGDRRARRAQRRLRHQRRAQDGPQGLHHLRAALRREPGRSRPRAGWSATCTTASRRCSRSSSTPG